MRRTAWIKAASSLLIAGALGACSTVQAVGVCPPSYKSYSTEAQKQAAGEMRDLRKRGLAPTIRSWIVDYGNLRSDTRILCQRKD